MAYKLMKYDITTWKTTWQVCEVISENEVGMAGISKSIAHQHATTHMHKTYNCHNNSKFRVKTHLETFQY